ncbi:MAG: TetR/AcrR family transcriptional regulator [Haliea sp.]
MQENIQRKPITRLSKETRVASILDAAREVFEEHGYENSKISDIAHKLNIVEGTVFHYFSSKRLLVIKVIEEFYQGITVAIGDGLRGIEGTRNRLYYITWFHLNVVNTEPGLCGVILRESRGLGRELTKDIHRLNRDYTRYLRDVLKEGVSAGDIHKDTSIPMIKNTLYGSIEHALWSLLTEDIKIDVDTEATRLTNLILDGISTHSKLEKRELSTLVRRLTQLLETTDRAPNRTSLITAGRLRKEGNKHE